MCQALPTKPHCRVFRRAAKTPGLSDKPPKPNHLYFYLHHCQAPLTNVPETIHSTSPNCPVDLCIVFETETLDHLFNFTTYSTSLICLIDPCIVFETETLPHLLNHHLCSEPTDLKYYSIRRKDMSHGGERVGLMIDDGRISFTYIKETAHPRVGPAISDYSRLPSST